MVDKNDDLGNLEGGYALTWEKVAEIQNIYFVFGIGL